ncbi:MAG: type III PLP-dependent enzyme [Proteobacteria bacterium]|nr:type III PLP-dependent enzyme [Pseudomonadota bacterium]
MFNSSFKVYEGGLTTISSLKDKMMLSGPQFVFRPNSLKKAVKHFNSNFIGKSLYAVKTNPDPAIIKEIYQHGIKSFDVASLEEVKLIHDLFEDAEMYFMHPVKPRYSIREAYFKYGVRHFSLDSDIELNKILQETDFAKDLNLHVRLSIPNNFAELSLSEKFGVSLQDAPELMKKVAQNAAKFGVCFHVGSQSMHPDSYLIAIRSARGVIEKSGITPNYFNVGGGFPSIYPGLIPPDLNDYFKCIEKEFKSLKSYKSMQLLAEPGRALVAESMSLIVRVELRKGNKLYINDGTYGSLFDAGIPNFVFPTKLICDDKIYPIDLMPFSFYGPTCDSLDYMKGPFYLPDDISEGDFIEIGQMGAYGRTMATSFNGFVCEKDLVYVSDEPLMTMYGGHNHSMNEKIEIIAA